MSQNVYTTVGTRMFISEVRPATIDEAGFLAIPSNDWEEIGEVTDLGSWGSTGSTASHQPLATGETTNLKSFIDWGNRDISIGRDITDTGHDLLKDLADGVAKRYNVVAVKIVHQSGLEQYSEVQITGFDTNLPGGDNVVAASVGINSRSRVIEVKPALNTFTLQYTAGANGSIIGDKTQVVASGSDGESVYAAADSGYQFDQWSDASTDNPRTDLDVAADINVTAQFIVV